MGVKYFPSVKYFREKKIFSSVWLHSKKCFGKYFLVFGYVAENAIENHFYHVSHIFLGSKQILLQRNKIYKQHKKQKSKSQDRYCERGTEKDRFVGATRQWTRWVDLGVGHSLGGSISSWVRGAISSMDKVGRSVGGFVARSRRCIDRCGWINVEWASFFPLSLSLSLCVFDEFENGL